MLAETLPFSVAKIEVDKENPTKNDKKNMSYIKRQKCTPSSVLEDDDSVFIVKIYLDKPMPINSSGYFLYFDNFLVRKYWQFPQGIYFKVYDPYFFDEHQNKKIRFSFDTPQEDIPDQEIDFFEVVPDKCLPKVEDLVKKFSVTANKNNLSTSHSDAAQEQFRYSSDKINTLKQEKESELKKDKTELAEEYIESISPMISQIINVEAMTKDINDQVLETISAINSEIYIIKLPAKGKLYELEPGGYQLNAEQLKKLVIYLKMKNNLTKLSMIQVGEDVISLVNEVLKNNNNLEEIDLSENHINDDQAITIIQNLKSNKALEKLHLAGNSIKNKFLFSLSISLEEFKNLRILTLSDNQIDDQGITYLSESLEKNLTIEELILPYNNFSDEGIMKLADMLKVNKKITKLSIGVDEDRKKLVTIRGNVALIKAIKDSDSIKELYLNSIEGGKELLDEICDYISKTKNLQIFNMIDKPLGKKSLRKLANSLESNKTIIDLDLSNCRIIYNNKLLSFLLGRLKNNHIIRSINLTELNTKPIDLEGLKIINNFIEKNNKIIGIGFRTYADFAENVFTSKSDSFDVNENPPNPSVLILKEIEAKLIRNRKLALFEECRKGLSVDFIMKLLYSLRSEGDVNTIRNAKNQSVLHIAVSHGNKDIVELLTKFKNIYVNLQDNEGNAPLHIAVNNSSLTIVNLLLVSKEANVNIQDKSGNTCLHLAVLNGNIDILNLLIENNANINLANDQFKSPICISLEIYNQAAVTDKAIYQEMLELLIMKRQTYTSKFIGESIDRCKEYYQLDKMEYEVKNTQLINYHVSKLVHTDVIMLKQPDIDDKHYAQLTNKAGITAPYGFFEYIFIQGQWKVSIPIINKNQLLSMVHEYDKKEYLVLEGINNLEGWWLEQFLPLRIRYLVAFLVHSEKSSLSIPPQHIAKLLKELVVELETLRAYRDSQIAHQLGIDNIIRSHVVNVAKAISNLDENGEYCYYTGYLSHAVYVNFCKQGDQILVRVDNLGDGVMQHHGVEKGESAKKYWPNSFQKIPKYQSKLVEIFNLNDFKDENPSAINYIRSIYESRFLTDKDKAFNEIYSNTAISHLIEHSWPAKTIQSVGNCVVKNHNMGLHIRLSLPIESSISMQNTKRVKEETKRLYRYIINNEIKGITSFFNKTGTTGKKRDLNDLQQAAIAAPAANKANPLTNKGNS